MFCPGQGNFLIGMPQQTNGPDLWPLSETTKILCAYLVIYWASWFNKSASWLPTTSRLTETMPKIIIVFVSHLIVALLSAHLVFGQYDVISCDCSWILWLYSIDTYLLYRFIVYLYLPQCLYDVLRLLVFSFLFISACFSVPLLSSMPFS